MKKASNIVTVLVFFFLLNYPGAFAFDSPRVELLFGASNNVAAVGNGRVSALVSGKGELTGLKWPSPSYYDHLNYTTSTAKNAHDLPHFGAKDNEGSFFGVYAEAAAEDTPRMYWIWQEDWTHENGYNSEEGNVFKAVHRHSGLGITVTEWLFAPPYAEDDPTKSDFLIRRYEISFDSPAQTDGAKFVYYANLAPNHDKIPFFPNSDYLRDHESDLMAVYLEDHESFIHFNSLDEDHTMFESIRQAYGDESDPIECIESDLNRYLSGAGNENAVKLLDENGEGIYVAIGTDFTLGGYTVGRDRVDSPDGSYPLDAFDDSKDGRLGGCLAGVDNANLAFSRSLDIQASNDLSIYFAFGKTAGESLDVLDIAKTNTSKEWMNHTEQYWADWISRASMPKTEDPEIIAFAKRQLLALAVGRDPESNAIVASVSVQPPYGLDWPRDGAFFNMALDWAGYYDLVTLHNLFYVSVQRQAEGEDTIVLPTAPAGTWAMNYYADGTPGGPIDFEIDETALMVWSFWEHARYLLSAEGRQGALDYLEEMYPAIKLASDALVDCRAKDGRICPANEDDNPKYTQGFQGHITTYLALRCAVKAAQVLDKEKTDWQPWQERADELLVVIDREFFQPAYQTEYHNTTEAWAIWPVKLFPPDDPRMHEVADKLWERVSMVVNRERECGMYDAKATLALAYLWKDDPQKMEELRQAVDVLVKEVPIHNTRHYGEVYVISDEDSDGEKEFHNAVSIPHIWEGVLNYMTVMAVYNPGVFDTGEGLELELAGKEGPSCECELSKGTGGFEVGLPGLLIVLSLLFAPLLVQRTLVVSHLRRR